MPCSSVIYAPIIRLPVTLHFGFMTCSSHSALELRRQGNGTDVIGSLWRGLKAERSTHEGQGSCEPIHAAVCLE